MVCKDWSLSPRLISSMSLKGNPGVTALTTASTIFRIRIRMSFIARYVSQIGQTHPPLNHSAHRHLSINCTHLFGINTLIRTPSKAHTSLHSVSSLVYTKWTLSMLSKRYIEIPTFCTYLLCLLQCILLLLAPTSVPIIISLWTVSLLGIRGMCYLPSPSHDLLRNKKQGCNLYRSKNYSIAQDTHLPLPSASVVVNKETCLLSNPLSESPSVTEDRTNKGFNNMSASDPFQEIVDALKRILTPAPVPPPPVPPDISTATSSPPFITSPMAKPSPFSGSAEECNGFLLQCSLALEMQLHLYPTERAKIAFLISLLKGRALQWAETIWSQAGTITFPFDNFVAHFGEVFGRPSSLSGLFSY